MDNARANCCITGYVGMYILKELLETGHRVRIVCRTAEKGKAVQAYFSQYISEIDVVLIKDQLTPGAYGDAAKSVGAIIHTASPFNPTAKNSEEELIKPAIGMVENILAAAAASPTVKRVAITSSCAAVIDTLGGGPFVDRTYTEKDWNTVTREQGQGPLGYVASKTLAERAAYNFISKKKPHFDLVTLCPTLVLGAPLQEVKSIDTLNASCGLRYHLFDAKAIPENHIPLVVSAADVARAHVRAIDVEAVGGKRILLNGDTYSFQAILGAMRLKFPELKDRSTAGTPGKAEYEGVVCKVDCRIAEELLGIKFQGWYDCIINDTVPSLLALEKKLGRSK
jgi:nucleoside-diphosphate-sugar epimerase